MMTDFRALCAELADAYLRTLEHINNSTWLGYEPSDDPLLQRARASLADEPPEPAPPADGEVAELVETLKGIAYWRRHGKPGEPAPTSFDIRQADRLDRAAELLERQASPACVVLKPSPELIEAFQDALPGRIEPLLEERHPAPVPVGERLPQPEVGE